MRWPRRAGSGLRHKQLETKDEDDLQIACADRVLRDRPGDIAALAEHFALQAGFTY